MTPSLIFERGDYLYFVAPVAPISPSPQEVEEYAFASQLRQMAPNEHLLWLQGRYVESERPNANGHLWTADELTAKSMTPRLMPITVMHDPRTAVGLIADTRLVKAGAETAEAAPRTRIDTTLAMWKHRFPDVAEEVMHNHNAGSLMQSMECLVGFYECATCGKAYTKLPGGAEKRDWCQHLRGETATESAIPVRRLRDVTFTGTGLIFGSRGARGAYSEANLDVFQDEVAEFHERVHRDRRSPKRRKNFMDTIEIKRDEYDALKADAARVKDLEAKLAALEEQAAKVEDLESDVEKLEAAKVAAETERDELKAQVEKAQEEARAAELSKDRLGKLGAGFVAKLGDRTKARLEEQAKSLSDEAWTERLEELAELVGVKSDEGGAPAEQKDEGVFSREEIARSQAGEGETTVEISPQRRSAVVTGLAKSLTTKK